MSRIIAGAAGGLRLATPPGSRTRPTSDRVREALFSRLEHLDVIAEATVLDLYAGSGALGLEALSRGATQVTLVESARAAAAVASRNARSVAAATGGRAQVVVADVARFVRTADGPPADLVFLDPPYDLEDESLAVVLADLVGHGRLSEGALVVVERAGTSAAPRWPDGLLADSDRRYGQTRLWFGYGG